jgi:hypothetical protein
MIQIFLASNRKRYRIDVKQEVKEFLLRGMFNDNAKGELDHHMANR